MDVHMKIFLTIMLCVAGICAVGAATVGNAKAQRMCHWGIGVCGGCGFVWLVSVIWSAP